MVILVATPVSVLKIGLQFELPVQIGSYISSSYQNLMSAMETLRKCLSVLENITSMIHLKQLQAHMIKTAIDQSPAAVDKLVAISAISHQGDLSHACSILSNFDNRTTFMWNMILRGFSQSREPQKALLWYTKMFRSDNLPDKYTFPFVLKACSKLLDLRKGQQVHSQIIKIGPLGDSHVDSSLVYFYTSCGELNQAKRVFEGIQNTSIVTWNVMISGCVRSGRFYREALESFQQMRLLCEESFDEFSLVSVSSACSNMGSVCLGKWIHGIVYKSGFYEVVPLGNSLVDMYGKCGSLDDACKVFDEMSERNFVSWSTVIDVCGMHGGGRQAVEVFYEMERVGLKPDGMTFTSILCACSHAGLLCEGKLLFERMRSHYGIEPKIQHYGCMVDLLGKAGRLDDGYRLIKEMVLKPDAAIWRSFISACLFHGNLELAKISADGLRDSGTYDGGDLVVSSNVFARLGRWNDVEELRRGSVNKKPSQSFLEVDHKVHEFVSGDRSHPQSDEIYLLINQMAVHLTVLG